MDFYEDYLTLYEVLKSDCSLLERKQLAFQVVEIYETLLKDGILYSDWHSKNLLFKNNLKYLDIDSAMLRFNYFNVEDSIFYLLWLCFSILNAIDIDIEYDLEKTGISKYDLFNLLFQSKVSEYFSLSLDFIKKEVENYTPSLVEYRQELILKKIKEKKGC